MISMATDELAATSGKAFPSADAVRGESKLASYRAAFADFTDEEMAILDGIIFEQES